MSDHDDVYLLPNDDHPNGSINSPQISPHSKWSQRSLNQGTILSTNQNKLSSWKTLSYFRSWLFFCSLLHLWIAHSEPFSNWRTGWILLFHSRNSTVAEIVDLNISRRAAAEMFFASRHLSHGRTSSESALREGHVGKKFFSSEFHHGWPSENFHWW